ncbi:MAG: CHASE3 domain-containing protein, partial [Bdellovibrionota bacterium]
MPKALEQIIDRHGHNKNKYLSMSAIGAYFLLAGFLITLGAYALYNGFNDTRIQQNRVDHTHQVQLEINSIENGALEAESSSRGFLLSGDNVHFDGFDRAVAETRLHLDRLRRLTKDNQRQQENLEILDKDINHRFELLLGRINLFRKTKRFEQVASQEGYRAMEVFRTSLNKMRDIESALLEKRTIEAKESEKTFFLVLIITTAFSLFGIFIAFRQYQKNQTRIAEDNLNQAIEAFKRTKLAEVSQLVAGDVNIQEATQSVLPYVADTVNALVAKFFVKEDGVLKCYASYASDVSSKVKPIEGQFETALLTQGLLGEAFRKGQVRVQKDLPKDFLYITSSLGKTAAQTVIFIPVSFQGDMIGIIELGLISEPAAYRMSVLEEFGEPIGIGLNAAMVREHTQLLLEKTQQQAEELESQQEELRTSNEE